MRQIEDWILIVFIGIHQLEIEADTPSKMKQIRTGTINLFHLEKCKTVVLKSIRYQNHPSIFW